ALFALLGVASALILVNFESMYQDELMQRANADLAQTLAREHPYSGSGALDPRAFADVLSYVKRINPGVDVYLLDAQGRVQAHSAPQGALAQPQVDLAPLMKFIARDMSMPLHGTDPRDSARAAIFSAAPIGSPEKPMGYVYVVLAEAEAAKTPLAARR